VPQIVLQGFALPFEKLVLILKRVDFVLEQIARLVVALFKKIIFDSRLLELLFLLE